MFGDGTLKQEIYDSINDCKREDTTAKEIISILAELIKYYATYEITGD